MKNYFFLLACLFAFLLPKNVLAQSLSKGTCTPKEALPAATLIFLENTEKVSSDGSVGQTVSFRVRGNVVVNGKVLIRDGAAAFGRIKRVMSAGYNYPAQLVLVVTHVRTADDQTIAVAGDEQTFNGKYTRQGFVVEQGRKFTATVMNTTAVIAGK